MLSVELVPATSWEELRVIPVNVQRVGADNVGFQADLRLLSILDVEQKYFAHRQMHIFCLTSDCIKSLVCAEWAHTAHSRYQHQFVWTLRNVEPAFSDA
jgi:hypothetical protein